MNKQAVNEIKEGRTDKALGILRNALLIVKRINEDPPKSRVLSKIFHTFGNLFKRCENFEECLKFFTKCAALESSLKEEEKVYIAMAYLNTASVYSLHSNHTLAIKHGTYAVNLMKKLVKIHPKMVNSLIIAYYNLAGEFKYIGDKIKAEKIFEIALNISRERLGHDHNLTETVSKALQSLTGQIVTRHKNYFKDFTSTEVAKLPEVRSKRSSSESRGSYHNSHNKTLKQADFKSNNEKFNHSVYQVPHIKSHKYGNNDKGFSKNEKVLNSNNWIKKVDLKRHRQIERNAAVAIQSLWRGYRVRKGFGELKLNRRLKLAEDVAKKAMEDYENVRLQIMKIKKRGNK